MLVLASEPVVAAQQAVLFYLYCDDVAASRAELMHLGVDVGPSPKIFGASSQGSASRDRSGVLESDAFG